MPPPTDEEILNSFKLFEKPDEATFQKLRDLERTYQTMVRTLLDIPNSRARSLALTALEESQGWAAKALCTKGNSQ